MYVYTAPPTGIIDPRFFDNPEDRGMGWVGAVIGAGSSILGPLIGKLFAPCGGANVACGLQGITSFGNQAIQTLQQIKGMLQTNPPQVSPQDAISNSQRIAAALSDGTVVYQAKKGKDAAALVQFKSQANALVAEITALGAEVTAALNAQAEAKAAASASPLGSLSSINPLLLVGGGIVAIMLLKKQ